MVEATTPLRDASETITGIIAVCKDITEYVEAET
jgi:PAS domain-containing protein